MMKKVLFYSFLNDFDRFRPCERMRKHALAGQNTQHLFLVFIPWFYYLLQRKCDQIRTRRTESRTEAILAEHQGRQAVLTTTSPVGPVSPNVSLAVAASPAVLPVEAPVQVQERAPAVIIEYDHGYGARP